MSSLLSFFFSSSWVCPSPPSSPYAVNYAVTSHPFPPIPLDKLTQKFTSSNTGQVLLQESWCGVCKCSPSWAWKEEQNPGGRSDDLTSARSAEDQRVAPCFLSRDLLMGG